VKRETKIHGPTDVAKYALDRSPMSIARSVHMTDRRTHRVRALHP
jgi:hypothetical protein